MRPKASIIIATRNRANQLAATLGSIDRQCYENIETIVVDDGSTDATPKLLEQLDWVTSHRLERSGGYRLNPGACYNAGHMLARARVHIEQNAEVVHVTDCVTPLVKGCRRRRAALATVWNGGMDEAWKLHELIASGGYAPDLTEADIRYAGRPQWRKWARQVPRLAPAAGMGPLELYCGQARPMPLFFLGAIHEKDFEEVGGYNETLAKNSDGDLAHRLSQAGISWRFLTSAVGVHLRHGKS